MAKTKTLEIGAGEDPVPEADITLDIADLDGIDVVADIEVGLPFDSEEFDTVVANHVLEHISDYETVFGEIARVLRDDGQLRARVPIGLDAQTDPTHESTWTYDTPEYFADGEYSYYYDLPFELQARDLCVWLLRPFSVLGSAIRLFASIYPRTACSLPALSGELFFILRRKPR